MPKIARFQLPDGRIARFSVPDEATPEQAQAMMSSYFAGSQQQTQQPAQQPQQKEYAGFKGSFMDSATQLGLADEAAAFMANPTKENRDKLLAAGQSKYQTVGFGQGNNWEAFKELVGGSLGSIAAPVAAGVPTGLYGAVPTAYAQYTIGAAQRAAERQRAQEEAGQTVEDISNAKILGAAAGETALDYLGLKFFKGVGGKLPGKLGTQIAKIDPDKGMKAIEESIKNGTYSLKGNILRGVAGGIAFEAPQEVAQQMLERYGAGLDLASPDAFQEYGQAALGAGILGGPLGAVSRGFDIRTARKNLEAKTPAKEKPQYMSRVEALVKEGFSIESAEEIVRTAEDMKEFTASPEEALAMARKQWEKENVRPTTGPVSTGESGGLDTTGVGASVPVSSTESGAAGVAGKPAEAGAVGLVSPDTGAEPVGGGEGGVKPPLVEAPTVPVPSTPKLITPEVKTPETLREEFNFEQPETTVEKPAVEPAQAEETTVEKPAAEPAQAEETTVEKPTAEPTAEPTTEPTTESTTEETKRKEPVAELTAEAPAEPEGQIAAYGRAVEAVRAQAQYPERVITPAYIAKQAGVSIEEANAILDKLHADGVVGAKRGAFGYEQVKAEEEIPAAEQPAAPVATTETPTVDANARKAELRSKIEQAFEDDVITEDQYRESMLALQKGTGISRKVLQLIGDKEAPAVKPTATEAPAQLATETKRPRDLTDEEFNKAHMALNDGEDLSPELLDALGVDPRTLPTTRVDQNTGKVNITGMSPRESILLLRERLDAARENLGLSKTAYNSIARDIDAGRDLSQGTLDLLGVTQGLSPAESRVKYLREVLNKKRREQEAAKLADEESIITGDTPEAKIEQIAAAKARYTTTVLQMVAKLLGIGKISRYEHAGVVGEVTKEDPNREVIAKLLASYKKRTKTQEPVRLPIDEDDAAELIVKRLDARGKKAGPRVMAAKARPKVVEGKATNVEAALEEHLAENTPDEVTGAVYGESDHHPEWATKALENAGKPEATLIYSDDRVAIYRGRVDGRTDYGVIEKGLPLEDLTVDDYLRTLAKTAPARKLLQSAVNDYEAQEVANAEAVPNGPFKGKAGQVVTSEGIDKRYANLLSALMKDLNLGGLRIFLYHPKDIQGSKRHLYGLYGDEYGNLDTMSIGDETFGHKVDIGERINGVTQGKDFAIMLQPGMSERLTVEVLTHELGHVIEDVAYQTASPEVKAAIKSEYDKWFKESYKMSPLEVLDSLKLSPEFTADLTSKDVIPGELVGDRAHDEYLRSFPEWWADNVARWMNTSAAPVSIIDKFFKSVAEQLRKLIQAVTGKPLPPNKVVASFLEDMRAGRRDYVADFLGQTLEIPEGFDMSDIFSTGYDASKGMPKLKGLGDKFREWFGDSKLADKNGRPLVMYHGMGTEMEGGVFKLSTEGTFGPGIYLAFKPRVASQFATGRRRTKYKKAEMGGSVLPLYARLERPFDDEFFVGNEPWQKWVEGLILNGRSDAVAAAEWGHERKAFLELLNKLRNNKATLHDFMYYGEEGVWVTPWRDKIIKEIRNQGYFDGFIYKPPFKKSFEKFDEAVVFNPEQVKSAIGNTGAYSRTDADIRYSKLPPRVLRAATRAKDANQQIAEAEEKYRNSNTATNQVNAVQQAIKDRDAAKFGEAVDIYIDGLGSGARDTALSTLTSSWLTERVEKILPSLRQASDLMDLIAGSRDRMQRAFSRMSKELSDYVSTNGQTALGRVIHFARLLQVSAARWDEATTLAEAIDADDEIKAYRDKAAAATTADVRDKFLAKAKERETIVAKVYAEWTALGQQEGGQAMYKKMMNFYRNAHTVVHSLLNKDIDNMPGLTPEQKAAIKKEADETFNISAQGEVDEDGIFRRASVESYFPWRRFGKYWLRVNKGDGEFYTFDSAVDREAFLRKRAKELGVPHEGSEAGKMFEYGNDIASLRGLIQRNNMSPMIQSMFKVIDKAHGAKGISLEKVKDDLVQMWLLTLPERSVRRQFIHSNDVTGMSTDLVRVFNDTASVYANQISKLQYGNRVRQQINAARQAIEPSEKSEYNLDPKERNRLESYINILDRRAEEFINPPPRNEMISNANHMAHLYYLSSPSHLLRNMLSVPMRTMPKLNALYGYGNAFAKAMKYLNIFNSMTFTTEEGELSPSIRNSRMLRNDPIAARLFEMGLDRNAMSGQGREIIRHDMASTNKAGKVFRALYDATTALFSVSERMSREMAYMMQAELAYAKYTKQGKSQEEALTLAANEAAQGVSSAVGNFSEYERPDFMRTTGKFGDAARSIFMFKMWSLSQAKFFWTYGNKVIRGKGLTTDERIEAMHELSGALAMAVTFAGVFGLPALSAIFSMIDFLEDKFLDDDEKKKRRALNPLLADSSEARFRYEWLPKHFGKLTVPGVDGKQHSIAQVIAQGPISGLTGVDIGAKATYNNMFFRSGGYSPSTTDAAANFIKNNLGPDVSLGVDFAEAVDNFEKGDVLRGVANLVPSIGKGFISAYRLQTEGAVTTKGVPIIGKDDLSTLSKLGNAVGFTPTALTDAYNRSSIIRDELLKMETEKTKIKNKFIQAILKHGDMKAVFEEINKFNARYPQPQFMLTADQLMNSVGNYQKTYATSIYGATMPKPEDWIYANWFMKDRYK